MKCKSMSRIINLCSGIICSTRQKLFTLLNKNYILFLQDDKTIWSRGTKPRTSRKGHSKSLTEFQDSDPWGDAFMLFAHITLTSLQTRGRQGLRPQSFCGHLLHRGPEDVITFCYSYLPREYFYNTCQRIIKRFNVVLVKLGILTCKRSLSKIYHKHLISLKIQT